eukprot:13151922-Alexandrium_andersonii.AAC.1
MPASSSAVNGGGRLPLMGSTGKRAPVPYAVRMSAVTSPNEPTVLERSSHSGLRQETVRPVMDASS